MEHVLPFLVEARTVLDTLLGEVGVELEDLVVQEGGVGGNRPLEVAVMEHHRAEVDFHTAVAHRTDVHGHRGVAVGERDGLVVEHVGGLAIEEFNRTGEFAVPQTEVHTHVERVALFPSEVLVALVGEVGVTEAAVGARQLILVEVGVVVADVVVTLLTERGLHLEEVDPAVGLHERFLGHVPCTRKAPEVAPTVVGMEARRTVAAEAETGEILFRPVVVDTTEETGGGVFVVLAATLALVDGVVHRPHAVAVEVLTLGIEFFGVAIVAFETEEEVGTVLTPSGLVGGEILLVEAAGVIEVLRSLTTVIGGLSDEGRSG